MVLGTPPLPPVLALGAAGRVSGGRSGTSGLVPLLVWALVSVGVGVGLPSPPVVANPTPIAPRLGGIAIYPSHGRCLFWARRWGR